MSRSLIRAVTALLVLLFVASFLSPALCNRREGGVCVASFPGYLAASGSMLSIQEVFARPERFAESPLSGLYVTTAWIANVPFILVSLLLLASPRRRLGRWAVIATALAAVDSWLVPFVMVPETASFQELLLPGYWLWILSLSLMAVWTFAVGRLSHEPELPA